MAGPAGAKPATKHQIPPRITRRLYASHFLSTWNSRVFEFGAVLYLAKIYPNTLLPMSAYALARGLAAILFSPLVGQYIDSGNRLKVVRLSIVVQRLVVAASCVIFYLLYRDLFPNAIVQNGMLALLAALASFEKLASILNLVAVEKDWVVVVAGDDHDSLRVVNSQMRRIDLLCKLFGPLGIALLDGISTELAILVNLGMNVFSIIIEYFAIARVYHEVPALQAPKRRPQSPNIERPSGENRERRQLQRFTKVASKTAKDLQFYFKHRALLPSLAGALLYLTVLSFGGQMVTYLLSSGFSSTQVGVARTFSVAFEVMATWVAPWLMSKIGPIRAGLWMSSWQLTTLVAGLVVFWAFLSTPVASASGLVMGTILSRVGLFGFDLCAQVIVQEDVEASRRGAFSSVEAALQNAFELLSFASTIVFSSPAEFRWPTLISTVSVTLACLLQAIFVRHRRKHLLHFELLQHTNSITRTTRCISKDDDHATP
ncbi:hypothetical protein M409DRAFT_68111 [Zasmidium cellare ATCC 36951]|uniref:Solute carrier family 40 member n=1 Tax=Zasmidium cellare ATCC 36951 TaxID=1080233 RepID=A0A6A6CFR9_ZASCE|nr:uncharacterized protein M409DRAFT_68111 [Zasmidium cellare ATCC 36951]KAF2164256.1 hypothetical protein M409DRAFT_68111 [Zasmidium cellare ATCC 36951]